MPPSDPPRARSATAPDSTEVVRPARIVVADDDRLTRELLAGILRGAGHTVDAVEDGQEAVERVAHGGVDLVLLDVVMPRLSGLEACRLLKAMTAQTFLPILLVTVKTDTASRVEGLKIGADDYVCKPFEEAELVARVASMLRIKRLHDQMTVQKARFEKLSVHDELTGLYNFRYLNTRLTEEFKRAERYHEPFACALIDIDQLRAVNDLGGRVAGDAAIRRVAEAIKKCVREVDVVARYGGEEFLVVLPSTHFAGSVVVVERIWREVGARPFEFEIAPAAAAPDRPEKRRPPTDPPRRPSWASPEEPRRPDPAPTPTTDPRWAEGPRELAISIGVALYPSRDVRTKDALLRAAEAALSEAKREGGNRICVFQQQGYIYTPQMGPPAKPAPDGPASSRGGAPGRTRPAAVDSWRPAPDSQEGGRKGS